MIQYILRRLLLIIPTFIGMTMLTFLITRIVPGGPLEMAIMEQSSSGEGGGSMSLSASRDRQGPLSEEQLEQLKVLYGLDKPWIVAYIDWLGKFLRLDFGESFTYYVPVIDLIKDRLLISAYYGIFTLLITYLVCISLGIAKALKHNTTFDAVTSVITFFAYAVPSYVVAVVLMVYFGGHLQWFPLGGFKSDDLFLDEASRFEVVIDVLYHSILPLISYLAGSFALLTYHMKSYLLEEISKDYVRTAVSKGVPYKYAVVKHAIRNSIIPIASGFGNILTIFFTGNVLIETIFNINGMGLLGYESLLGRDYPVVISSLGIFGTITLIGNLLGDIAVAIVDPRVKYT